MSEEMNLLKSVCQKLDDAHIAYMLTGSLAANFYAVPRMTRDIDFVIELLDKNVNKFFQCFHSDFYVSRESIEEAIKHQTMFNIIHNGSIFKIDFVIRKDSDYRNTEFQRRCRFELDGAKIWIVSPEDLIISKLIWAKDSFSELQIRDVRNLLRSIKNLDEKYIANWIDQLNLKFIYEKVKNE